MQLRKIWECLFPVLKGLNPNKVVFLLPYTEPFIQVITGVFIGTSFQVLSTSCTLSDFASKGVVVVGETAGFAGRLRRIVRRRGSLDVSAVYSSEVLLASTSPIVKGCLVVIADVIGSGDLRRALDTIGLFLLALEFKSNVVKVVRFWGRLPIPSLNLLRNSVRWFSQKATAITCEHSFLVLYPRHSLSQANIPELNPSR